MRWQVQEAKHRFSEVLRAAQAAQAPQAPHDLPPPGYRPARSAWHKPSFLGRRTRGADGPAAAPGSAGRRVTRLVEPVAEPPQLVAGEAVDGCQPSGELEADAGVDEP